MKYIYVTWAVCVFLIVLLKDGLSADNVSHICIITLFFATYFFYKPRTIKDEPKFFFISRAMLLAAIVEGFYMITKPVFPSLQIVSGMSLGQMIHNYVTDLIFTLPAYFIIFYLVWRLITKYEYTTWQFIILFALGQALGDGSRTFLANPGLLAFLPYVMINYQAMTVLPFLKIKSTLQPDRKRGWWRFAAPIILIPLVYTACGVVIYTVGSFLKL